jgi:rRNA processing protein Krr1/Pno1
MTDCSSSSPGIFVPYTSVPQNPNQRKRVPGECGSSLKMIVANSSLKIIVRNSSVIMIGMTMKVHHAGTL